MKPEIKKFLSETSKIKDFRIQENIDKEVKPSHFIRMGEEPKPFPYDRTPPFGQ